MTEEQNARENWHPSQRGWFGEALYLEMKKDKDVWLLVGDLGYRVFDKLFKDFPERTINVGASEQAMLDIACGMALSNKKVFAYSITSFLLYRGFETLRTYIDYEKIPVRLVASGRNLDYEHDGWSHHSTDAKGVLNNLSNIYTYWPNNKEEMPEIVTQMVEKNEPSFISLRR